MQKPSQHQVLNLNSGL